MTQGFRLSPQQERAWQVWAGSASLREVICEVLVEGTIEPGEWENALGEVVRRHEILRTRVKILPGLVAPFQFIEDEAAIDFGGNPVPPGAGPDEAKAPALRVERLDSGRRMRIAAPLLTTDRVGLRGVLAEAAEKIGGRDLAEPEIQYADIAEVFQTLLESEEGEAGRRYWSEQGLEAAIRAESGAASTAGSDFVADSVEIPVSSRLADEIRAAAVRIGVPLEAFLLASWALLAARLGQRAELVLAVSLAGRSYPEIRRSPGLFTRVVPIRVEAARATRFADFARAVAASLAGAVEWQDYFTWNSVAPRETGGTHSQWVLPLAFACEEAPDPIDAGTARLIVTREEEMIEHFRAKVRWQAAAAALAGAFEFDPAAYSPSEARRLAGQLSTLLAGCAGDPAQSCRELSLLSDEERSWLLGAANDTERSLPVDDLYHLVRAQAERTPDHAAVVFEDRHRTFGQLIAGADRVAERLAEAGLRPEGLVALAAERSIEWLEGLLGILGAGGAYVPLDPLYPAARLAELLADSGAEILLAPAPFGSRFAEFRGHRLDLDESVLGSSPAPPSPPSARASGPPSLASLAYVIYTSGSSGRPKGVMVSHAAIANRLLWMLGRFPLSASDTVLQKTSFSFDASIWEIFAPLIAGARLVLAIPGGQQDSAYLAKAVERERVTTLQLVPSQVAPFVDESSGVDLRSLQRLFCGGEALTPGLVAAVREHLGIDPCNLYGPTETAIDSAYWPDTFEPVAGAVPIGCPIDNVRLYVVDGEFRLVGIGEPGELVVGGAGLARGYVRRPEATSERFIPDPFGPETGTVGARLYRTGDLVRHRDDGALLFLGRIDDQVKVRGYRIELGEIESTLRRHPGVSQAVVILGGETEDPRLIAYVVPYDKRPERARPGLYLLPNGLEVSTVNDREADFIYQEIFLEDSYFRFGVDLREGDTVFDVGANIGMFSMFVRQRCASVRLFAFEPIPPIFERLRVNLGLHAPETTVFNCGLSAALGRARFTFYGAWSGMSGAYADASEDEKIARAYLRNQDDSLVEFADELLAGRFEGEIYECRLRTLSEVIAEQRLERIDLLKIDVEKSELDVLEGLREEDWPKVRQVVLEAHDIDGRLERISALLERHGFEVAIDRGGILTDTGLANIYAVHRERRNETRPVAVARDRNATPTPAELSTFVAEKLPAYMVPSAIVLLDAMPTTPNGKVDRRALPVPERVSIAQAIGDDAPSTELEELVVGVWSDVLGVERIGLHANFFDLGGHSLLATRLASRLRRALGVEISLRNFFENPTVAGLVHHIEQAMRAGGAESAPPPIEPAGRNGALPTSFGQRRLWFLHQLNPVSPAYHIPAALEIEGDLDIGALGRTFEEIVRRHESLRTRFILGAGEPEQVVEPAGPVALPLIDLGALPENRVASEDDRVSTDLSLRPFDLGRGGLFRLALLRRRERHVLLAIQHHIVSDGWSTGILLQEIGALYPAFARGATSPLAEPAVQYADYSVWQRRWFDGEVLAAQLAFWRGELGQLPAPLDLPTDRPRPRLQSTRGARAVFVLPSALSVDVRDLARRSDASLFMTFAAAFGALLHRSSGQLTIVLGTPISGRRSAEIEPLIGFFVNTLALRLDLAEDLAFADLLSGFRARSLAAFAHQDLPFEKLVEELQSERDLSRTPVFQTMLVFEQEPPRLPELPGLSLASRAVANPTAKFDLTLFVERDARGLSGALEYNTDLFDPATIRRLARHLEALLGAVAANPRRTLADLPLLNGAERHQLVWDWNDTAAETAPAATIHSLFERTVDRQPEAIALVADGRTMTFSELDRAANRFAHRLMELGAVPEQRVGICLERGLELSIALLAVLKTGAAFVPMDPVMPSERLRVILEDSASAIVITSSSLVERLPATSARQVVIDAEEEAIAKHPEARAAVAVDAENLAYAIYTSGSTGVPNGVMVPHGGAVNYLDWAAKEYLGVAGGSPVHSSIGFDLTISSLFVPLLAGRPIEMVADGEGLGGLGRALERGGFSFVKLTPAHLDLLSEMLPPAAAAGATGTLVLGGEALRGESLAFWAEHAPDVRVVNEYGPTETVVGCSVFSASASSLGPGAVGIGRPIANAVIRLLSPDGSLAPLGVVGELCVGGLGVARGYLSRPGLTASKFVPDAWSGGLGARLYRTGDLARNRADGSLEYLGRRDLQIKVRGHRIEPGEIESALMGHPRIEAAAVVALADGRGQRRLVAYFSAAEENAPTARELREWVAADLPEYMVPSSYMRLDRFPLTPNGKIDRRALPRPEGLAGDLAGSYEAPRSEVEIALAAIWQEVLEVERVGIHDNFFDLGGHSLLLVRVRRRIEEVFESDLTMLELFQHPTVAALAERIRGEAGEEEPRLDEPVAIVAAASGTQMDAAPGERGVAIIGMACRVPGATSPDELWANLEDAVESISFFSAEELGAAGVPAAVLDDENYVRANGALEEIDLFDAAFFGFHPREAEITDPQHRIFLECAWEALENAAYDPAQNNIGIFAGSGLSRYLLELAATAGGLDPSMARQAVIANDKDYLATKASYKMNLRGPSVTVQTACSTSLVATHLACRSLLMGECDLALAGGVSIDPAAKGGYFYEEGGITSRDGHCRAFDARSGGTVPGNGAGVVVLKRLSEAERDGDPIYAVILGTAINNDGSDKVGYTAPSVAGQAAVIAQAQRTAGVAATSISYVEAHGTGTLLGDPIEVAALQQVFGRQGDGGCALGSIKTNLGHLDAAAGVAGLMKASLSLWRESIPASLHFEEPNSGLSLAGSPFYVNARLREWPRGDTPRRAGVSSFGIGGTNAHVVLEEAPLAEESEIRREWVVLPLSGRSEAAVESSVKRLAGHVERHEEDALAEVGWTLQTGRRAFGHRRALVARNRSEALRLLASGEGLLRGEWQGERAREVVFAFPGQGVQRFGLGRTLYEKEEAFRAALDESASLFSQELGWDVREAWFGAAESGEGSAAESSRLLSRTAVTQPALFAWEYALACQWRNCGVSPVGLVGHSLGEYVAAVLSGVMTLAEGARLVALRGRLMGELSEGGMLALAAGEEEVSSVLGEGLSLAAVNAPRRVVVSGPRDLLSSWWSSQSSRGWEGRYLETSHAFHSGMLEPILGRYARELSKVRLRAPQIPMVSNVTGNWLREDEARDVGHWVRQLRDCVRFGSSVTALMGTGDRLLLEVGPGRTLSRLARQQEGGRGWKVVGGLTGEDAGGEEAELQRSLAQVWAHGAAVDWRSLHRGEKLRRVHLPTYPFERRRFWIDARPFAIAEAPTDGRIDADSGRWCYAPLWRPTVASAADPAVADGPWLALVDQEERSAEALLAALANRGIEIIAVNRASFDLAEDWRAGFARRLRDLAAAGRAPRRILHLWSLGASEPSDLASFSRENPAGLFALFEILRALNRELSGREIGLDVVTSGALAIESGAEVRPERAALIGPARIFRQESVEIASRLIDVDLPGESERERWADQVAAKLASPPRQALMGLRRGRRFELGFDPLPLSPSGGRPRLLRRQGVYLITGAFGGVGRVLARELVRSAQARLLLCGTVPLPPRRDWATTLEKGPPSVVDRLRFVAELEAAGAEVETFAGDASQPGFAPAVVEQAIARFGALHGIVHAAGVAGDAAYLPASETDAGACEVQLAPKALAALHLANAVRGRDLDFVLLCSSLATVLGGLGFAAYAAANHALEAIGEREDALGATRWISVAWDGWQLGSGGEAGPSLDPSSGAECFRRILDHGAGGTIAVSTSDLGARLRRSVPTGSEAPETPADARGDVPAAPDGDLEAHVLRLFRALLGIEQVRASDDFFALGGDSLLATQLASRLRRDFAVELPLRAIFEQPTPAGLAQRIAASLEGADRLDEDRYWRSSAPGRCLSPLPSGASGFSIRSSPEIRRSTCRSRFGRAGTFAPTFWRGRWPKRSAGTRACGRSSSNWRANRCR